MRNAIMSKKLCYLVILITARLLNCYELDVFPDISTESSFLYSKDQFGRANNQTDDIVSTIYSTVASVAKNVSRLQSNDAPISSGDFFGREELKGCSKTSGEEEIIVRPLNRICDYVVTKNHSGICSLEVTLTGWEGECRDNWLEVGAKLECGTLTGTRIINFDRSAITLKMRSSNGVARLTQIPCSTQVAPPTTFADNLTIPLPATPVQQLYPAPYIPPNLRPSTSMTESYSPTSVYVPQKGTDLSNYNNQLYNELSLNKVDTDNPLYQPDIKYPLSVTQQNHQDNSVYSLYRPGPQTMYSGMRYGPPECDKNSGVVIHSPGYPNNSPQSECFLMIQPNTRLCSPFIYFDFFEFGIPQGSACRNSRLEIGGFPFCGCLSGVSWQVPRYIFSSDGSLSLHFRGQGRFLITIYYDTCRQGYNPYPPDQRSPWRCVPLPSPSNPNPQPYPVNPYPPVQPYPFTPSPRPSVPYPPPKPVPIPQPPRPYPPQPIPPQPSRPFPRPEPTYPYPPKEPPPYPPFPYPPQPSPQPPATYPPPTPLPPPKPFPPPRPVPQPRPPETYPPPYPDPYPRCKVIQIPQGTINCAPIQPQSYCYRFEPPQSYCQMIIKLEKISMSSNQNCNNEYLTTGERNPRICEEDMENIPIYLDRGGYLQGKLMPGSVVRASFEGLPCSCNVDYRQTDFTIRATPPLDVCHYSIHKTNEGICSLEITLENIDLQCGQESLVIDEKSYCGSRAYEKLEVPFLDPKLVIEYRKTGQPSKPGSFSIRVSQRSKCVQPLSSAISRGIKYSDDCILPLSNFYGVIEFPGKTYSWNQILTCSYDFQPKEGYCYVRIDFDEVDIPNSLDCTQYYIGINGIKYCGNTLSSSTKVLELIQGGGNKISYQVDRSSKWRFTYTLLPCKQEISARAQNAYSPKYNERFSFY